ncbi:MAG: hypothetical protein UD936_00660 [Acutalibacteraceae bacterium]|nr:hypothetical protein [Acutalibacteraceae bacterium]
MTNYLNSNSNPSGYDSRYHTADYSMAVKSEVKKPFVADDVITDSEISAEIEKQKERINQFIQQSGLDNKQESEEKLISEYLEKEYHESLSDISQLKVSFIVKIIKRKLAVLHRVRNHRLLKDKKIPDSLIIEREIEKRASLNIVDMLAILKYTDKNKEMSTQQKVLLMNDLNRNVKLTIDEKLAIVTRIIKSNIVTDPDSCKHLKNKLTLLFIVKESGFSIDVTKVKGYKPVMNDVDEPETENNQPAEEKLVSEVTDNETVDDPAVHPIEADIIETDDEQSTDDPEADDVSEAAEISEIYSDKATGVVVAEKSKKAVAKVKPKAKVKAKAKQKPQVTKTFVNSKRHFKFGAGYIAKNDLLTILLPSGYVLDKNKVYQANTLRNSIEKRVYDSGSPLCITVTSTAKPTDYSLVDFYNSNLIECRDNKLKYRNTVISKAPAVLKHKPNSNIYTASVFVRKYRLVYDINFTFKKTVANTASTVNRILASILFEGM